LAILILSKIRFRALEMGILNTTFIKVVEWLWLAFTVIVIIMLIGMKIGISSIRKKARRQQVYYAPNQIYVN